MKLDWEIAKDMQSKSKKEHKAKKDDNSSLAISAAKAVLDKGRKAEIVGAQIFQLYANISCWTSPVSLGTRLSRCKLKLPPETSRARVNFMKNRQEDMGVISHLHYLPPDDGVQAQYQGSSEVLHHQYPQEAQSSVSASVFQVHRAAQRLP
jgi:hypothetical protein